MYMKRTALLIMLSILAASGVCRAETTIKAELDKRAVTADDTVTYKVTVISSEQQLPPPVFPDFKGFSTLSSSQSSSFSFSGSGTKTMLVYVFVLLPDGPGPVTIPPVQITAGGKKTSSESFTLQISPGTGKFRRPQPPELGKEPQYDI
jgi:hypothetical protein